MKPTKEWYAVHVERNHERSVAEILESKDVENYLPLFKSWRKWSDRRKETEIPIFRNYLFCRIDIGQYMPVVTSIGVIDLVRHGKRPAAIPEKEIADLKQVLDSGLEIEAIRLFSAGDPVRIMDGPLKGVDGRIVRRQDKSKLAVGVTLMNRDLEMKLDPTWIEHIELKRHPVVKALAARAQAAS